MTEAGSPPGADAGARAVAAPRLPLLLQAVLSVGTDLELRTTLQHVVDTAAELTDARYGALGVVDPERGRLTELFTTGLTDAERERVGPLPDGRTGLPGALIQTLGRCAWTT